MNLLRQITIDSAGNRKKNEKSCHNYKTIKWKISANQGKKFKLCTSDF